VVSRHGTALDTGTYVYRGKRIHTGQRSGCKGNGNFAKMILKGPSLITNLL
jgi:hypothetical protein